MKSLIEKWSPVVALVAIFLLLLSLKNCNPEAKPIATIPEINKQDSFRTIIKYRDSVRTETIIKWRTVREKALNDTTPCATEIRYIVQQCDTVIKVDSLEILSLKNQHSNDSTIIFKQGLMLKSDSIYIGKLNRKVKRNRTIAKLAFITGIGLGGFVGVKVGG